LITFFIAATIGATARQFSMWVGVPARQLPDPDALAGRRLERRRGHVGVLTDQ
jgi:hypothetical protein